MCGRDRCRIRPELLRVAINSLASSKGSYQQNSRESHRRTRPPWSVGVDCGYLGGQIGNLILPAKAFCAGPLFINLTIGNSSACRRHSENRSLIKI
jgi:hypothetical protein